MTSDSCSMGEIERIKTAYERRALRKKKPSLLMPCELHMHFSREVHTVEMLQYFGISELSDKRILDVSCSRGARLRDFLKLGADPMNLFGIDLVERYIEDAVYLSPNFHFTLGNAERMPYPSESFDIVQQATTFSSILSSEMKARVANDIMRVLKPGGLVLWFDFMYDNPSNKDVKGIGKNEMLRLFPGYRCRVRRLILAPPIVRRLARYSIIACHCLEKLPILCTHYLACLQKPANSGHSES